MSRSDKLHFDIRRQGLPVWITLGTLIVLNIVVWAIFVRPKAVEYGDRVAGGKAELELNEFRDKVLKSEEFFLALGQAEQDLTVLRDERLGTRDERIVEIQQELTRLCREFGIDLATVSYKNERLVEQGLDRFAMIVPLEGGYANLRRFLQAIESSDQFLVVERVQLGGQRESRGNELQLNITVGSYFRMELPAAKPKRARRSNGA